MSIKKKSSLRLANISDVSGFLRTIADRMDGVQSQTEPFSIPSIDGFTKLEVEVKKEEVGAFKLKLKAKTPESDDKKGTADKPVEAKPSYKTLKKRLEKSYKEIKNSLYKDTLPAETSVSAFLQDSEILLTLDGKGNEFYPSFEEACSEFEAFENKDLQSLIGIFAKIKSLKDTCHDKYE
jgi:XXXCH domain-containing protein